LNAAAGTKAVPRGELVERKPDPERTSTDPGAVHHVAFALSAASFNQAVERLHERGIEHSGVKDRGFMDSIELLAERSRESLSEDRAPKDPYS
jgi:hypothetical protein